jgi:hypothetical protein
MARASNHASQFASDLQTKFKGTLQHTEYIFFVTGGRTYDKIWAKHEDGTNQRIFAFVHRLTGGVYKPNSTKAPAPGERYHSPKVALEHADLHGAFLYEAASARTKAELPQDFEGAVIERDNMVNIFDEDENVIEIAKVTNLGRGKKTGTWFLSYEGDDGEEYVVPTYEVTVRRRDTWLL